MPGKRVRVLRGRRCITLVLIIRTTSEYLYARRHILFHFEN